MPVRTLRGALLALVVGIIIGVGVTIWLGLSARDAARLMGTTRPPRRRPAPSARRC